MDVGNQPPNGAPAPTIRASLCGTFEVSAHGRVLGAADLGGVKPRLVLAFLLLRVGHRATKEDLAEALWGDHPPVTGMGTLDGYLSLLRKRLEPLHPTGEGPIRTVPGGYLADPALIDVDTQRFRDLADRARLPGRPPAQALVDYAKALDVVAGGLLRDEAPLPWIQAARRAHTATVGQVTAEAGAMALRSAQPTLAEHWAQRALLVDGYNETAWRALLESLEMRGQYAAGLRAYDACWTLLDSELGCAPGPAIRAVSTRMLAGTIGSDDDGLGHLVEAVVHLYQQASTSSAVETGEGGAPRDRTSFDEACGLIDSLISTVRQTRRLHLVPSA